MSSSIFFFVKYSTNTHLSTNAVVSCKSNSCLNHWGQLFKKSHDALLPCSKRMPLSNIIPFTQFLPSCCRFESLKPLLTDYLGFNLKNRCEKKLFGAKASTIQQFYLSLIQWRQLPASIALPQCFSSEISAPHPVWSICQHWEPLGVILILK